MVIFCGSLVLRRAWTPSRKVLIVMATGIRDDTRVCDRRREGETYRLSCRREKTIGRSCCRLFLAPADNNNMLCRAQAGMINTLEWRLCSNAYSLLWHSISLAYFDSSRFEMQFPQLCSPIRKEASKADQEGKPCQACCQSCRI